MAGYDYVGSLTQAGRLLTIDTPLGNFSAGLRTIWLSDPDGITNYFAQILRRAPSTASR